MIFYLNNDYSHFHYGSWKQNELRILVMNCGTINKLMKGYLKFNICN